MGCEAIDELTVIEYSGPEVSKTPEANDDAIENKGTRIHPSPDDKEGLEELGDSDEEPCFPFESRGRQKSQIAGNSNSTNGQAIRPVKQSKGDETKADKAEADKK